MREVGMAMIRRFGSVTDAAGFAYVRMHRCAPYGTTVDVGRGTTPEHDADFLTITP